MNVLLKNDSYYHCSFINKCFKHSQNFKLCYKNTCKRAQNLHNSRKSVPLHRVFHSIRFKVNKRLEFSGTPFLCPYLNKKIPGPEKQVFFKPGILFYAFIIYIGTIVNPPLIFFIGRNQILRIWHSSQLSKKPPYTHLSHIQADFHEITRSNIIDMCMTRLDILSGTYIMFQLFCITIPPLVVTMSSFFSIKIFYRITE